MQNQTASCYESNQAELAQHVLIVNCMPREQDTCRSPTNAVGVREDGWIKTNGFVILQTLSKRQNYEERVEGFLGLSLSVKSMHSNFFFPPDSKYFHTTHCRARGEDN